MRAVGLYDPRFEHDACGVAFVARLTAGVRTRRVERALKALANLEHRGAAGADALTGDGAGILVQVPDSFFRRRSGRRCRRPAATGSRCASCRTTPGAAPSSNSSARPRWSPSSATLLAAERVAGNAEQVRHVDAKSIVGHALPEARHLSVIPGISCMTMTPGPSPRV